MWLRGIFAARWFPYALIGLVTFVGIVFGYGYLKGYNKAETVYLTQLNEALERQMKVLVAQKQREIRLALLAEEKKHNVGKRVAAVPQPAISCELPPACVQWFDAVLHASTAHRRSPD